MIMQGLLLFIILLVAIIGIYIYLKNNGNDESLSSQEHLTSPHMTVGKYLSLRYRGDNRGGDNRGSDGGNSQGRASRGGWTFKKYGKHIFISPPPKTPVTTGGSTPTTEGSGSVSTTRGQRKPVGTHTDPVPTQTQSPQTGQISDLPILQLTVQGSAQPYVES